MGFLKDIIKREQFNPGLLGVFVNPFFHSRRALFREMTHLGPRLRGRLLDVGCGHMPYRPYLSVDAYVGMELDTKRARSLFDAAVYYDGHSFPFEDGSFDAILANEVLEHVFNPDEFLGEVQRVLRDGGLFLLTVPFAWDEHEQPHDFARYSSFGLRHVLESHGFHILEHRKTVTDIRAIFQLLNEYVYKVTYVENTAIRFLLNILLIAPLTIISLLIYWFLPSNPDMYLDNVVLAEKRPHA